MNLSSSNYSDLARLSECHQSAFPKSLSSRMGKNYLCKMLEWYIVSPKAFIFHLVVDNEVVGYCGGLVVDGELATGSASAMTQYSFNSAVKSILMRPWLLFHGELLKKYSFVLRNLLYRFKKPEISEAEKSEKKLDPYTGLVVIGVNQKFHGIGYGSFLLQEFEKRTKNIGLNKMLLTVKSDNDKAIKSYLRNGWEKAKLDSGSLQMVKYI
ncbi:GNAT family N-acetyltransferase [Hyphobacterium sp. CCMP332]|nr:GNAT family N-acetyltransferase [Hyphobacterium sp. CCMP332]